MEGGDEENANPREREKDEGKSGRRQFNEESICQVAPSQGRQNRREGDAVIRDMELKWMQN